mgnify:FL=1
MSTKVRDAIFGNVGTMTMFRVGAIDAEFLEKEFEPEFTPIDMVNLPNHAIYLKLTVDGVTSRPFSAATLPPFKVKTSSVVVERIIESSRKRYCRPRPVVEDEIKRWAGMMTAGDKSGEEKTGDRTKYEATCSSCGKATTVNFEPMPGRPIYCKDCLAKVKSGEMAPVRSIRMPSIKPSRQYTSDLANIGIEFGAEDKREIRREEPRDEGKREEIRPTSSLQPKTPGGLREEFRRPPQHPRPKPPVLQDEGVRVINQEPSVSLSSLKPEGEEKIKKEKHTRSQIDIEELRKEIKESLEKAAQGGA